MKRSNDLGVKKTIYTKKTTGRAFVMHTNNVCGGNATAKSNITDVYNLSIITQKHHWHLIYQMINEDVDFRNKLIAFRNISQQNNTYYCLFAAIYFGMKGCDLNVEVDSITSKRLTYFSDRIKVLVRNCINICSNDNPQGIPFPPTPGDMQHKIIRTIVGNNFEIDFMSVDSNLRNLVVSALEACIFDTTRFKEERQTIKLNTLSEAMQVLFDDSLNSILRRNADIEVNNTKVSYR